MIVKVSDYIAQYIVDHGITHQFTVTGGGAMFLNDSFGHQKGLKCIYNHHEQACSVAAEGYTRATGKMCSVCVTTGPGGTNTLTGVMGAWLDSVPMLVFSGQVKIPTTTASCPKLKLRQLGDQEFQIITCAKNMTKYAVTVTDPKTIKYHLAKAMYIAVNGRPGPVWLDIPIDVQSAKVDTDEMIDYDPKEDSQEICELAKANDIKLLFEKLNNAKRPVVLAGEGIRISDTVSLFRELAKKWQIPVCLAWNADDLIGDENPYNCGRPSTIGTRGGNYVLQTADLVISLGCRMNIRQISYNYDSFARNAYLIAVDIDEAELNKPTIHVDLKIHADLKDLLPTLLKQDYKPHHKQWLDWAKEVAFRYPSDLPSYYKKKTPINPYVFAKRLGEHLAKDEVVVASNATAAVCLFQATRIQEGQRMFSNSGSASMGYGLPAALGAAVGVNKKRVICLEGDGSIQMNIQELQTVVTNKIPLKIFWLNNEGYHSIRQTQTNTFNANFVGVGENDGISFPEAGRIADAYRIPFYRIENIDELDKKLEEALTAPGYAIIEIVLDKTQFFAPKLSSKILPDGTIVSPSLEDMYPFLEDDEKPVLPNTLK